MSENKHTEACQMRTVPIYGLCTCDFDQRMQGPHAMTDTREDALRLRIWRTDGDRVVITHTRELRDDEAESARLTRAVSAYIHALNGSNDAVAKLVERGLRSTRLLLQNATGCVENHHGHDIAANGEPGWLADCRADIDAMTDALAPFTGGAE